jgi:hypothetical protein
MPKNKRKILFIAGLILSAAAIFTNISKSNSAADNLYNKTKGRILLQVEDHGRGWYVNPESYERYFLGKPEDAFEVMQDQGKGITNNDLKKIPINSKYFNGTDTDGDGLPDKIEQSIETLSSEKDSDKDGFDDGSELAKGYNPLGKGLLKFDKNLQKNLAGFIIIQVQSAGEAWYVDPVTLTRFFLGRPADAFEIMKKLGLGIKNTDLARINEHKNNPLFDSKILIQNDTKAIDKESRKYTDRTNEFSFVYPVQWNLNKYETATNTIYITDSERDFFLEKKALIYISYIKRDKQTLKNFEIAFKNGATKTKDATTTIDRYNALVQSFEYPNTNETTTFIEKGNSGYIMATLITSKNNDKHYNETYQRLLNSIDF